MLRRYAGRLAGRLPRRSVRLRLTVLYSALFLGCGAALLAITFVLVAHFPLTAENRTTVGPTTSPGQLPSLPSLRGQAERQRDADLHHLIVQSGIALAITTVVSIGLGWFIAGRVLRPLRTITAAAQRISASNLHERLGLPGPQDELKELGDTFDALLDRLERTFVSQRQFVANASHELRTPLTLERALLEAALTDPNPTPAAWRNACERALAAGVHQERLIEALLTLARSEGGLNRWEPFDLATITGGVLHARRGDLDRCGIRLAATLDPLPIRGDARLAERMVANLVDNALRHNVDAGVVEVRTGNATLSVANTGPLIHTADVARLFQPFQRLATARAGHDEGLGLGLSIVGAITDAHGADVAAVPRPSGGLEISVTFPRV